MPQPILYRAFDGTCAEAMRFYAQVLRGKLGIMTTRQSPFAEKCPPGMPYQGMHGVSIALNYDSVEEAQRTCDALAEGGTVTMPFSDTFWAKKFSMLKDRFGCHWIVNGELVDMRLAA